MSTKFRIVTQKPKCQISVTDTIQPRFYCRPPHWREIYFNFVS